VGALQVDPFARRVGRQQDFYIGSCRKNLLHIHPFLPAHPAVDGDYGLSPTEKCRGLLLEIVQRVAVFCEDDQLAGGWRLGGIRDLDAEWQMETPIKLVLPLLGQTSWGDHEAAL
jgi:hypothetical protein